jgi:dihydroxyacetone kinase-like predicted kinase
MNKQLTKPSIGRVSIASKPVKYKHVNVKKNEYIGIIGKNIISSNRNLMDSTKELSTRLYSKSKHAYIFYGGTCTIREAEELATYLRERYLIESEIFESKQKNYFFTVALV